MEEEEPIKLQQKLSEFPTAAGRQRATILNPALFLKPKAIPGFGCTAASIHTVYFCQGQRVL